MESVGVSALSIRVLAVLLGVMEKYYNTTAVYGIVFPFSSLLQLCVERVVIIVLLLLLP